MFVFYAGLLHAETYVFPRLEDMGAELYNGAYVYVHTNWLPNSIWEPVGWYRPDKTPVLLADVPKELLTYMLIL